MTKPRPSVSPSTISARTQLIPRPSTRKRTNLIKRGEWKKSAAYSYVWDKARAIQAGLDPRYPSFIKFLLSSHATRDILCLPVDFCRNYLHHDDIITLVGEDGMKSPVVYLSNLGLRGGWEDFCAAYNLQVGDALVCHLVSEHELKVYSVRVNDLNHGAQEEQSGNIAVECSSPEFVDLKSFRIIVNGSPVDSGLSVSVRVKYYELCLARKSYLHSELLKRINHQLATGMILETISIVNAIRACCLSTSLSDIKEWETNLEGFRLLGMDVSFLLARVKELLRLAVEYQESREARRWYVTTKEEKRLSEEIASLETKLMEFKDARANLQSEREVLEAHFLNQRLAFQEMARMPW